MARLFALAVLLGYAWTVQACMFARDAQPAHWHEWASGLFAADVASVERQGKLDVITVKVVESFKGPRLAVSATLEVPERMWASCRLVRPAPGERVLVALSPQGDALLVPLSDEYAERLRRFGRKD